jgi:hypothetical protein
MSFTPDLVWMARALDMVTEATPGDLVLLFDDDDIVAEVYKCKAMCDNGIDFMHVSWTPGVSWRDIHAAMHIHTPHEYMNAPRKCSCISRPPRGEYAICMMSTTYSGPELYDALHDFGTIGMYSRDFDFGVAKRVSITTTPRFSTLSSPFTSTA